MTQTATEIKSENYTDLGNANRLVARHGVSLKYIPEMGWLVWSGKHWKVDSTGEVMEFAKETIRSLYREAADIEDTDKRQNFNHSCSYLRRFAETKSYG